jgi:hypothetical protein
VRRRLTPLGLAWTAGCYLALGLLTAEAVRRLAEFDPAAGPVILFLALSTLWTGLRICVDGEFLRGAAWFTGIALVAVIHIATAAPTCGNLVFGSGLPGVSPGIAPCLPHQDFMATAFIAAWVVFGPLATAGLTGLGLYRWLRREPLHAYRFLTD